MSDTPAEHLSAEPQEERGEPGSRDKGADEPAAGPADRPAGTSSEDDDSAIDPQGSDDDAPHLPTGD